MAGTASWGAVFHHSIRIDVTFPLHSPSGTERVHVPAQRNLLLGQTMSRVFCIDKVPHVRDRITNNCKFDAILFINSLRNTKLLNALQQELFFVQETGANAIVDWARTIVTRFLTVGQHVDWVSVAFAEWRPMWTLFMTIHAIFAHHFAVGINFASIF